MNTRLYMYVFIIYSYTHLTLSLSLSLPLSLVHPGGCGTQQHCRLVRVLNLGLSGLGPWEQELE